MNGPEVAAAAKALVGAPYRLNGRDPMTGLDCLGVVAVALALAGWPERLPLRSTLHRSDIGDVALIAQSVGLVRAHGVAIAGDILLVRCSAIQPHLLIAADGDRFIHAHAALRRVVLGPVDAAWSVAGHWRLPAQG